MDSYEKIYPSQRKLAKTEARKWKDRKQKTYKQFCYFRHRMSEDYKQTLGFLSDWLPKAWSRRHEDVTLQENIRDAVNLTIYLKHLYNNLK